MHKDMNCSTSLCSHIIITNCFYEIKTIYCFSRRLDAVILVKVYDTLLCDSSSTFINNKEEA